MRLCPRFFLTLVTISARSAAQGCSGNLVIDGDFETDPEDTLYFASIWFPGLATTVMDSGDSSHGYVVQLPNDYVGYVETELNGLTCPDGSTLNFAFDILFNGIQADLNSISFGFEGGPPLYSAGETSDITAFTCSDGWSHIEASVLFQGIGGWIYFYIYLEDDNSIFQGNVWIDNVYLGVESPPSPTGCLTGSCTVPAFPSPTWTTYETGVMDSMACFTPPTPPTTAKRRQLVRPIQIEKRKGLKFLSRGIGNSIK